MYLLFDIGATNMRFGVSKDLTKIDASETVPTPATFSEGVYVFKEIAEKLAHGAPIKAIAGGIAGPLSYDKSHVWKAPNLKAWNNKPFKTELQKITRGPVYIENDAALAGLGEAHYGAGKGKRIIVYYTISSGVGGSRIVDGKIDRAHVGFEPGHQIMVVNGKKMISLEQKISGVNLQKRYHKDPSEIKDTKVWDDAAQFLTYGLYNSILHWSPEIIILGGGIILHNRIQLFKIRSFLRELCTITPVPILKKARLGEMSGLYGAMKLLL